MGVLVTVEEHCTILKKAKVMNEYKVFLFTFMLYFFVNLITFVFTNSCFINFDLLNCLKYLFFKEIYKMKNIKIDHL